MFCDWLRLLIQQLISLSSDSGGGGSRWHDFQHKMNVLTILSAQTRLDETNRLQTCRSTFFNFLLQWTSDGNRRPPVSRGIPPFQLMQHTLTQRWKTFKFCKSDYSLAQLKFINIRQYSCVTEKTDLIKIIVTVYECTIIGWHFIQITIMRRLIWQSAVTDTVEAAQKTGFEPIVNVMLHF